MIANTLKLIYLSYSVYPSPKDIYYKGRFSHREMLRSIDQTRLINTFQMEEFAYTIYFDNFFPLLEYYYIFFLTVYREKPYIIIYFSLLNTFSPCSNRISSHHDKHPS